MYETLSEHGVEGKKSPEEAESIVSGIMDNMDVSPVFHDRFSEPLVAQGVVEACRIDGEIDTELLKRYLAHSSQFDRAAFHNRDLIFGEEVVIPQHDQNLQENGDLRRRESGPRINVEDLDVAVGVDPRYVLMFRATQPSAEPKPELYWTTNPAETLHGLHVELGSRAPSAIILIASLASVAENGVIGDINDDGGVAMRQLGDRNYSQSNALASIARQAPESEWDD